jgi:hypothetical protein
MESIPELRKLLQTNVLGHPILQRVLSIYITRVILPTRITANQITVIMLLVGVASAIPFFYGEIWWGLALSYLCILLDASDGEVARYRKTYSLKGIYLDLINHLAIQAWFFLGLGYAVALTETGWMADMVLIAAAVGALSFPLRRANGDLHREIYVHHYRAQPERFPLPAIEYKSKEFGEAPGGSSLVALIKKCIYYSEYHAVMLIEIAAALILEWVLFPDAVNHPILFWLVVAYAAVSTLYLLKEVITGYRDMDRRVASVHARLTDRND